MQPRARLDYLDGLRGLAALAVVFQHASQIVSNAGNSLFEPVLQTINLGRFGVVLFFLISGFVIPFSFKGEQPLRQFARSRFFRLYPAYWAALVLLIAIAFWRGVALQPATILANLTLLHSVMGQPPIFLGSWTLLYELAFYVFCAALYRFGLLGNVRLTGAMALILLADAIMPFVWHWTGAAPTASSNTPFFFAIFLLGMLVRSAKTDEDAEARRWVALIAPLALIAGLLLSGFTMPVVENGNRYLRPVSLALGMTMPVIVFLAVVMRAPATSGWLIRLGAVSYSVYLFQDVVQFLMPWFIAPAGYPVLYVAAVILVTIALSSATYRFVERPMIALGRERNVRSISPVSHTA